MDVDCIALRCVTMHCLALRTGAKPRHSTRTPGLLAKPCTLVHLRSSAGYTIQPCMWPLQLVSYYTTLYAISAI